eukprot:GHUV01031027.1.p1 GENE.GHUV01031027.1~~GHUV01031027.1.p1  ORF type:complete len:113 (+),score=15.74 GHUV01031027.1:1066-1404(+)
MYSDAVYVCACPTCQPKLEADVILVECPARHQHLNITLLQITNHSRLQQQHKHHATHIQRSTTAVGLWCPAASIQSVQDGEMASYWPSAKSPLVGIVSPTAEDGIHLRSSPE